jgi:hypothetical protein
LDELTRLLAERDCERLVYLYATYADTADVRMPEIFSEDAILHVTERLEGREAIRASRASRPPLLMRHLCSNVVVDVLDADHARGHCYLTAYVSPEGETELGLPAVVGEYNDQFARTADGWKISERLFTPTLRRPA